MAKTQMQFRFDTVVVAVGEYDFVTEMFEVKDGVEIVHLRETKRIYSFMEGMREEKQRLADYRAFLQEEAAKKPRNIRKPARKNKTERGTLVDGVMTYADGSKVINGVRVPNDK